MDCFICGYMIIWLREGGCLMTALGHSGWCFSLCFDSVWVALISGSLLTWASLVMGELWGFGGRFLLCCWSDVGTSFWDTRYMFRRPKALYMLNQQKTNETVTFLVISQHLSQILFSQLYSFVLLTIFYFILTLRTPTWFL